MFYSFKNIRYKILYGQKSIFLLYIQIFPSFSIARSDCYLVKQKEKDPQEWLVKIQSTSSAGQEAEIMQLVPHLHSKPLIIDEFTKKSYIVMWKLPGKNLFETLQSESLSTDQKMQLSLELLLALKNQVHSLDLVHGDIKTENIMVSFNSKTSAPIVDMIDYGSSSRKEDRQSRKFLPYFVGFCEAAGFEPCTQASDIFSLGKILYQLFCKSDRSNLKIKEEDLKNLTINHQHRLEKLIKSMFASDPESRPTIGALISEVEAIQDEMTRSNGKNVRFSSSFFQSAGLIASEESANSLFSQVKHAN
ncbi:MAG: protein kinase [Pseudomonadota bacterium]